MRYFIGFLIRGEAAEYQSKISREIREEFMSEMRSPKIPPHITIFRPFDSDDPTEVKNMLTDWSKKNKGLGTLTFSSFEHFDDRTIFVHVDVNEKMSKAVADLQNKAEDLLHISSTTHTSWHPHVTVATRILPNEFYNIWNRVKSEEDRKFSHPFDNITLFRLREELREWVIEQVFPLAMS